MIEATACTVRGYIDAISAETVVDGTTVIGDLVQFDCRGQGNLALSTSWAVILTAGMMPYSNARFATRDGAWNYMALVAAAKQKEKEAI